MKGWRIGGWGGGRGGGGDLSTRGDNFSPNKRVLGESPCSKTARKTPYRFCNISLAQSGKSRRSLDICRGYKQTK